MLSLKENANKTFKANGRENEKLIMTYWRKEGEAGAFMKKVKENVIIFFYEQLLSFIKVYQSHKKIKDLPSKHSRLGQCSESGA